MGYPSKGWSGGRGGWIDLTRKCSSQIIPGKKPHTVDIQALSSTAVEIQ